MFSSTTSLLGSRGLAHYAAANQALDALAHYRRARNLPALTVNWGTWDAMGDTPAEQQREYLRTGLHAMRSAAALNALGRLLAARDTQAAVAQIDWEVLRPIYEARRRRPLLSELSTHTHRTPAPSPLLQETEFAAHLAASSPSDRLEFVLERVRAHAASVLAVQPHEVDVNAGLFEMGMDSLMSVELKGRLQKAAGISLPSTLTFNYPTVRALASYLLEQLAPPLPAQEVQHEPEPPAVTSPDTDQCSEDELAMLLAATLKTI
jgi:myxalamid-type polyketide synthase MxaE and MxaD